MDPDALCRAFSIYPKVRLVVVAHLYGTPGKIDEVPEESATAYPQPISFAAVRSTSSTFSPTVETQFVLIASSTYFCSSPCMVGEASHTFFVKGTSPANL